MTDAFIQTIHDWQSFCLLAGGAAATLIGLTFIAASVGAGLFPASPTFNIHTWVTPIIRHFTAVLLVCVLLTVPTLTPLALSIFLGIGGLAGLQYIAQIALRLRKQNTTSPLTASDIAWQVVLPGAAYFIMVGTAIGVLSNVNQSLTLLCAALVLLITISIRNTWDLFVWIAQNQPTPPAANKP